MVRHLERWSFVVALTAVVSGGTVSCSDDSSGGTVPDTPPGPITEETAGEIAAASNTPPQNSLSPEDEEAIEELIKEARQNLEDGKHLIFAKKFMNTAKVFPPQASPVNGKADIATFAKKMPKITSLSVTDLVVDGAGKNAVVTANVAMLGKTSSTPPGQHLNVDVDINCSLLVTLKKNGNGKWRAKNVSCPSVSP